MYCQLNKKKKEKKKKSNKSLLILDLLKTKKNINVWLSFQLHKYYISL